MNINRDRDFPQLFTAEDLYQGVGSSQAAPILPFLTPLYLGGGRSMLAGRSVSALFTHKNTQLLLHGSSSMWTPGKEQGSYHPLASDSQDNS